MTDHVSARGDSARTFERLEPLPDPFGLSVAATASSPLHGRLAFVAIADPTAAATVAGRLARPGAGRARTVRSDLFATGLEKPWLAFQLPSDVGLSQLVGPAEFLTLQRRLADDLLVPAAGERGRLVDASPAHANDVSVRAIRSLFPDAVVAVDAEVADRLPAWVRDSVVVWTGSDLRGDPVAPVAQVAPSVSAAAVTDAREGGSPLQDRLVVVVGCGRSGTTWLQELLLAHPQVAGRSRHESWLFHQLRHLWSNHARPDALAQWVDDATFVSALRRYCDGLLDRARRRCGGADGDFFVEKTPAHVDRLKEIAAVYPDAWVLHLMRDGRAVARSMVDVPFFDVPDLGAAAATWARAVATVRAAESSVPRLLDVRYEELRADPAGQLGKVCAWIGLDLLPEDDHRLREAIRTPVSAHRAREGATPEPLGTAELAVIHRRAGAALRREGYVSRTELWRARLSGRGTR